MLKEKLIAALGKEGYQDIRYEVANNVSIKSKNRDIGEVNVIKKSGGHARALCGGGIGTFSFNKVEDTAYALEQCVKSSKLMPGNKKLAPAEIVKDKILANPKMDPRRISIEEKKELLLKYSNLFMDYEGIANVEGDYYEAYSEKTFVNNEGTVIEQEALICGIKFAITSKGNGITQQTRLSIGGCQSYDEMLDKEQAVLAKAKQTVELLSAKPVVGGLYDVILDGDVGGLFIHEAFGHLSEADNLLGSPALRETMAIGTRFGRGFLNVIDDPTMEGNPGSYIYDDEGVRGIHTYLIKDGILSGRLHSRETAALVEEQLTGHARAKDYSFPPIVRMGNIYIDKGPNTMEEMIASIKDGLYLFGSAGGQTSGEMFTFAVQGAYAIKDGKMTEMVRDIALSGNLFETLENIEMIGDCVDFSRVGGCGKAGQIMIKSGKGSAPIKIKAMAIGGK
ncbi:MAG: peptidase modulator of gyrase [Clostridia bacterium]|nr:peptidase modulator of gyrase [Clostridia bacterium]